MARPRAAAALPWRAFSLSTACSSPRQLHSQHGALAAFAWQLRQQQQLTLLLARPQQHERLPAAARSIVTTARIASKASNERKRSASRSAAQKAILASQAQQAWQQSATEPAAPAKKSKSKSKDLFEGDDGPLTEGDALLESAAAGATAGASAGAGDGEAATLSTPAEESNASSSDGGKIEYSEPETIYTGTPAYNVPLLLGAMFVGAVVCFNCADLARAHWSVEDPDEPEGSRLAPKWQRYSIAAGFAVVGTGLVTLGMLIPARLVTRLTLARPVTTPSTIQFPRDGKVTIYGPLSRVSYLFPPRTALLRELELLGPLSSEPRAFHPQPGQVVSSTSASSSAASTKGSGGGVLAALGITGAKSRWQYRQEGRRAPPYVPIVVKGDYFSYTLSVAKHAPGERSGESDKRIKAWCKDFDGLERALLGFEA